MPKYDFDPEIEFLGMKIQENPLNGKLQDPSEESKKNRLALKEIIVKRIVEGAELLHEDALEEAIELSGGHIRQFIALLSQAALHNLTYLDGEGIVSKTDVKEGSSYERQKLSRKLIEPKKIELLRHVLEKNTPISDQDATFLQCALSNQVFVYKNSNFWYDVNPLIKGTVKLYAKQIKERGKNDSENA